MGGCEHLFCGKHGFFCVADPLKTCRLTHLDNNKNFFEMHLSSLPLLNLPKRPSSRVLALFSSFMKEKDNAVSAAERESAGQGPIKILRCSRPGCLMQSLPGKAMKVLSNERLRPIRIYQKC